MVDIEKEDLIKQIVAAIHKHAEECGECGNVVEEDDDGEEESG